MTVGHLSSAPGVTMHPNQHVSDLIVPVSKCWNHEAIVQNMVVGNRQAIFNIPIGRVEQVDQLAWPADRRGRYTVK